MASLPFGVGLLSFLVEAPLCSAPSHPPLFFLPLCLCVSLQMLAGASGGGGGSDYRPSKRSKVEFTRGSSEKYVNFPPCLSGAVSRETVDFLSRSFFFFSVMPSEGVPQKSCSYCGYFFFVLTVASTQALIPPPFKRPRPSGHNALVGHLANPASIPPQHNKKINGKNS